MRRAVSITLSLIMILSLYTSSRPTVKAQGGGPEWTIGDYWEYSGTWDLSNQTYNILFRIDMKGRTDLVIETETYDTFLCNVTISIMGPSPFSGSGDMYFLASDLSSVKTTMNLAGIYLEIINTPPLKSFEFPLNNGLTWSSTNQESTRITILNTTTFSNMTTTTDFQVSGPVSLTVTAGTFEAFNITAQPRGTTRNASTNFYSDVVGNIVTSEGYMFGEEAPLNLTLRSYNYQKSPANGGSDSALILLGAFIVVLILAIPVVMYLFRRSRETVPEHPEGPIYGQTEEEEEYTYRPPPPS